MLKKVLTNTFFQIIGKIVTAATTFLLTIIIGRALGPAGYGDFTKIFVFVGYFYTFADFGLNPIFIKLAQKEQEEKLLKYLVGLRLIGALFLALIASTIAILLPYNPATNVGFSPLVKTGIILASLTILTQALINCANAIFQKRLRYDFQTITYVSGSIVILATIIVGAIFKLGLLFYVLTYVIQGIVFVIIATRTINKFFKLSVWPRFSSQHFKNLLKNAAPIGTALVFNLIYFRADVLILSYARQSAEVGLYGLAYQFFEAALTIPIFFANSLYPGLAEIYNSAKNTYQKEVKKWAFIFIAASLGLSAALFVISYLIPVIYGWQFTGAKSTLQILSLGMPFFFTSALLWHLLIINGKQKFLAPVYLFGAAVNVTINLIFIPSYGYLAAASVTVVSEALIVVLLLVALRFQNSSAQ